jgi:hypothetical protein
VISHRVCLIISKCTPPNINRFLRDAPDFLGIGVYKIIYIMSTVFVVVMVVGIGGVKKKVCYFGRRRRRHLSTPTKPIKVIKNYGAIG